MTGFNIIFGHPAIGKTTALQGKYKDRFIDWDVEYNEKRDRWIEEHTKTKKGTKEFKDARNKYLIYPENYPDYIEFLTREWNRVKNKAKQENKLLLVSPHNLLKLFPNDFNYIIDVESSDFISRNINRGGNETNSKLWKEGIDKTISNVNNIPKYTIGQGIYLSDLLDNANNASKVVDENGEPLVVYHGNRTDNKITTFDTSKKGTEHKERAISGFWFTTDKDIAKEEYALKPESRGKGIEYLQYGEVIPVFLNIKNPVETEQQGITVNDTPYGILTTAKEKLNDFINRSKALTRENTDGYILTLVDSDNRADDFVSKQIQLVVFNPNQIKSATSNTEFSTENNNIYKSEGPKLRRKNTWKELVKNNPVLAKLDAKNQAIVEKFIQQHLKEEAQGAIWRDVSSSYFDMNTNEHTPNRSVKDMLDYIYENTTDNQLKELIDILRPNITNEVNKLPIFYYNRSSSSARAFYEATDREIHVFRNAAFGSNKELARQNFERTMVHEIVHAMTVDYLSSN